MITCFEQVLGLDPTNSGGFYYMAVGLLSAGETGKARACLARALELGHSPEPEFLKALESGNEAPVPVMEIGSDPEDTTK